MDKFLYKKAGDITALSASIEEFSYKKHCHEEYALGVTLRGVQQYYLDGSLQASHPSGVMLFAPEQAHDGRSQERTGIDYIMLYIKPPVFQEIFGHKDRLRFSAPIVYDAVLERKLRMLSDAVFREKEDALCSELLLSVTSCFSGGELRAGCGKDNSFADAAREMIYYSTEDVLKIEAVCKAFDMSKFQFIRAFQASTGISPYQYFLNRKIERAKTILERSGDPYAAVAECGFVDLPHLNRHFKRVYGTTAFEYTSQVHPHKIIS